MGMHTGRTAVAVLALLAMSIGAPLRAQSTPPPITATDLGTLGGTRGIAVVQGMNDVGMVVGGLQMAEGYHAFAWTAVDGYTDLGTLNGGKNSMAYAVNDLGQVVGTIDDASGYVVHVFLWTKTGGMVDLGTPTGTTYATPHAINNKGWIGGDFDSAIAQNGKHAFFWSTSTGFKDLGSLGGSYLTVSGMNNDGVLCGTGQTVDGYYHGFVSKMKSGPLKDLGTLGAGNSSSASAINNAGQVTGNADSPTGSHAYIYSNGKMKDIHTIGYSSFGAAINANGMVVGQVDNGNGSRDAFVYTATGGMVDIGTLGYGESRATAVNKNGVVTGVTGARDTRDHAFLWTAVGGMVDAGSPDDLSSIGMFITSSGQIAGQYVNNNNDQKAFFEDPTNGRTNIKDKGWGQSTAVGVNATGVVTGSSINLAGYTRAFVWSADTGMAELYAPTGMHATAVDINDAGKVIGNYGLKDSNPQGFLWSVNLGFVPITAGGYTTTLIAINKSGQIIGYGINASYQNTAFLRQVDGTMVTIVPPVGGDAVQPRAFNDSAVVVGQFLMNGSYHGFKWSATGGFLDLGTQSAAAINANGDYTGDFVRSDGKTHAYLQKTTGSRKDLGEQNGTGYSTGIAINATAQVAGNSGDGFFYDTQMRNIGSLGGGSFTLAMNDGGQVVGWSYTTAGQQHGFVYAKAIGIRDLGTLGGVSSKAVQINNLGQACGEAGLADGSVHAVLWNTK